MPAALLARNRPAGGADRLRRCVLRGCRRGARSSAWQMGVGGAVIRRLALVPRPCQRWPGARGRVAPGLRRPCQRAVTGVYSPAFPKFRLRVPCLMEINPILNSIKDLSERSQTIRGYL